MIGNHVQPKHVIGIVFVDELFCLCWYGEFALRAFISCGFLELEKEQFQRVPEFFHGLSTIYQMHNFRPAFLPVHEGIGITGS